MKLRLLAAVVLSIAVFTGCGAKEEAPATTPETGVATEQPAETEATDGVEVKKSEIAQEDGTLVTEVTFENGQPVDVQIDFMQDGKSKYELAAKGEYVMVEGAENTWDKQVDALEAFIKENNFDLSKITVNDEGKTDVVSGVSVSVSPLLAGVEEILASK